MTIEFPILPVEQPIGVFYIASIPADILLKTLKNVHRSMGGDGVQRDASKSRIKEIASFCSNTDSVFPTPIIVSVYNNIVELDEENNKISFDDNTIIGEVLDGQHRLLGLEDSDNSSHFNMPVVFMFGLTPEEKAYIFSIINSKQTKVNQSLLYDLFELTSKRSPQKTAHEIARSMNSMQESPFFNRLKMLGTKDVGQDLATLSQGTFAQSIMLLFSKHPNKDKERLYNDEPIDSEDGTVLRMYFYKERDEVILKVLLNCFTALSRVFSEEWGTPSKYILCKTTGFRGVIKSLPSIIEKGIKFRNLTQDFFYSYFIKVKESLDNDGKSLTSQDFGSGEAAQNALADCILKPLSSFTYTVNKYSTNKN